jgi:hypothetical protein
MKVTIPFRIMQYLHSENQAIGSGRVAQVLRLNPDRVQSTIPKLMQKGFISRLMPREGGWPIYYVTEQQWGEFLGEHRGASTMLLMAQTDDAISRKLKFLNALTQGVHGENPVLGEIISDYVKLRQHQSETEKV